MRTKGNPVQWAAVEFMVRFHRELEEDSDDDAEVLAILVDDYMRAMGARSDEVADVMMFHAFLERVECLSGVDLAWALGVAVLDGLERESAGASADATP